MLKLTTKTTKQLLGCLRPTEMIKNNYREASDARLFAENNYRDAFAR
jgi:hypothetical protein